MVAVHEVIYVIFHTAVPSVSSQADINIVGVSFLFLIKGEITHRMSNYTNINMRNPEMFPSLPCLCL